MSLQPFASADASQLILPPQGYGRAAPGVDDRRDRRSGVKGAPSGPTARTMADHAHQWRADGFQAYGATRALLTLGAYAVLGAIGAVTADRLRKPATAPRPA